MAVGSSSSVVRSTASPPANVMSAVVVCARVRDSMMLFWRSDGMMGAHGAWVRRLDENMFGGGSWAVTRVVAVVVW